MDIVKVKVPLCGNIEVTCTRDTKRKGYWFINPPIPHPNIFECNTELLCDDGETPQMLLEQTEKFSNPCNLELAVLFNRNRNEFDKKMEQLKHKECSICFDEFERSFEFITLYSNNHFCCDRCYKKIEHCPLCNKKILK
jgi:hypothetical protein